MAYYGKERYKEIERRRQSIVQCLKEGMRSTKQIADELGVSQSTVQRDIRFILENQKE